MAEFAGQYVYIDRDSQQFDVQITYYIPGYSDPETGEYFGDTSWTASYGGGGTGGWAGESDSPVIYLGFGGGGLSTYDFNFFAQNTFSAVSYTFDMKVHEAGLSGSSHSVTGHAGLDLIVLGSGDDTASGLEGSDYLDLGGGSDTGYGGAGGDYLDGGAGDDILAGGADDDTYVVDSAADIVTEAAGEGYDTVFASVNWTVAANVERLVLTGAAQDGSGDAGDNVIEGNELGNELLGLGGNDQLSGYGADDVLRGGDGDDWLDGGTGADRMIGGLGNDTYHVDSLGDEVIELINGGFDTVHMGSLTSYTLGAHAEHLVVGTAAGATATGSNRGNNIYGAAGNDILLGMGGNDRLYGGGGDDLLDGGVQGDVMFGGSGFDIVTYASASGRVEVRLENASATGGDNVHVDIEGVIGSAFDDLITGRADDNLIIGGAGADNLFGGLGIDTLGYQGSSAAVAITLGSGVRTGAGGDAQGDSFSGFENVTGGDGSDTLNGDGQNNVLMGGGGDDVLSGKGSADVLIGGVGADSLDGGAGYDWLSYATSGSGVTVDLGLGTASGGDAAGDSFTGFENLRGSAHGDSLTGNAGNNEIQGLAGNDTLFGGDGNDVIEGGAGADAMNGGGGFDTLTYANAAQGITLSLDGGWAYGGASGDTFSGFENLVGSGFGDGLYGGAGANKLYGGAGHDFLSGGLGNDTLEGGTGQDSFYVAFGGGTDRVMDFVTGAGGDYLYVELSEDFDSFGEVMAVASDVNGNAVFNFGGGVKMTLVGVSVASITADNVFIPTYEEF